MYKKALIGEIRQFTGISDPYEPPLAAELVLRTIDETPQESAVRVIQRLEALQERHRLAVNA